MISCIIIDNSNVVEFDGEKSLFRKRRKKSNCFLFISQSFILFSLGVCFDAHGCLKEKKKRSYNGNNNNNEWEE